MWFIPIYFEMNLDAFKKWSAEGLFYIQSYEYETKPGGQKEVIKLIVKCHLSSN